MPSYFYRLANSVYTCELFSAPFATNTTNWSAGILVDSSSSRCTHNPMLRSPGICKDCNGRFAARQIEGVGKVSNQGDRESFDSDRSPTESDPLAPDIKRWLQLQSQDAVPWQGCFQSVREKART